MRDHWSHPYKATYNRFSPPFLRKSPKTYPLLARNCPVGFDWTPFSKGPDCSKPVQSPYHDSTESLHDAKHSAPPSPPVFQIRVFRSCTWFPRFAFTGLASKTPPHTAPLLPPFSYRSLPRFDRTPSDRNPSRLARTPACPPSANYRNLRSTIAKAPPPPPQKATSSRCGHTTGLRNSSVRSPRAPQSSASHKTTLESLQTPPTWWGNMEGSFTIARTFCDLALSSCAAFGSS